MNKECYKYATLITALIDRELNSKRKNQVQQHLDDCPDCHESFRQEKRVKHLVKEKVQVTNAPGYLNNRIRRLLIRDGNRPTFWEIVRSMFVYRPAAASFALAMIGFWVILPIYKSFDLTEQPLSHGVAIAAELKGEIVCLDCELLTGRVKDFTHESTTHHSGLQAEDGSVWTFLRSPASRELFQDKKLLKRKALISGTLFRTAKYIQVTDYKLL